MDLATKIYPSMALDSNIRSGVPPLPPLSGLESNDRSLLELEDENDDAWREKLRQRRKAKEEGSAGSGDRG